MCTWNWDAPKNYKDVINNRFVPFTGHVSNLIKQAKETPGWNVSAADLNTLDQLDTALYQDIIKWKGKGDKLCAWDAMGKEQNPWAHAGCLRDEKTKPSRNVNQGDSTKKLRPQVRIKL